MTTSYAVGEHFESFIKKQVQAGRYNNASEIVRDGLRLVEERELKLKALREHVANALATEERYTDEDIAEALAADNG